jgi:acyl transferase domain-containing protein
MKTLLTNLAHGAFDWILVDTPPVLAVTDAVILAPAEEVRDALASYGESVSIAAFNGPENVVISGRLPQLDVITERFAQRGYRVERLRVSHAFHSPLMEDVSRRFALEANEIRFATAEVDKKEVRTSSGGPVRAP